MRQLEEPACLCARTRIDCSPLHGRGVFAARAIRAGEMVIENPALPLGNGDVRSSDVIARYCFEWPFNGDGRALALGEASLLNHAPAEEAGPRGPNGWHLRANLRWETDTAENRIVFYAARDIEAGEQRRSRRDGVQLLEHGAERARAVAGDDVAVVRDGVEEGVGAHAPDGMVKVGDCRAHHALRRIECCLGFTTFSRLRC